MDNHIPKVLYVDDELDNLNVFRMTFDTYYDIYTAISAKQGLQLLKEYDFSMVISDERMPTMTGVEFLKLVKNKYPFVTRVILTGYSDMSSIVAAINKGRIYHYLTKPWDESQLKSVIDNAIKQHDLIIENQTLITNLKSANDKLEMHNRSLEDTVRERMAEILEQQKKIQEVRQNVIEMELLSMKKQKENLQNEIEIINKKLTTLSLQKIQKNKLMTELKEELRYILDKVDESYSTKIQQTIRFIVTTINTERDWQDFKLYFEEVHAEFYSTLKQRFHLLTPNEIHLCALLRLNMNIKQASQILGIAPDSVKMARYRLRKKMGLSNEVNLIEFLMEI